MACKMCYVKLSEDGGTPGYARPPSAVLPVGSTDKKVLDLGSRRGRSALVTRSSNLYQISARHQSAACLVM